MSSRSKKSSSRPPSVPAPEENREPEEQRHGSEGDTGTTATETLPEETLPEESAQVQLTIKGSDKSARAAARRFGEGMTRPAPPVISNGGESDDPVDPIADLLSDGKNMVLVTRQKPRMIQGPDGRDHATNVRIPGAYTCPTSKAEIEELVFQQHGGAKYKCTIHPDTTDGANKILGHFTIEHPDSKCPPYIDGVTINLPEPQPDTSSIPTEGDPHLKETDPLAMARTALQRRLERAQVRKEIEELEAQVKEMEGTKTASPVVASAEAEELKRLREQIAERDRQLVEKDRLLSEKKVSDRFDKLEGSIAELASALKNGAGAKPAVNIEESFMMTMLKQTQQHSKDMIELMKTTVKPAPSQDGDMDKMLDRLQKLQTITGGGPGKGSRGLSSLEEKLIDMSFERLTSGGGGDGDEGDIEDLEGAVKLAIKQFAPIAKTYVEKKMDQESKAAGGAPISPEQVKQIYAEAAQAAAKKVQDDLAVQGLVLQQTTDGRLVALPATKAGGKPVVPPRSAGTKVMSETRTAGGVVKKISIQPDNLTGRPKPDQTASAPAPEPAAELPKGDDVPKCGVFPMLGANGADLKIEFPVRPGDLKYDRKYSVNFILDGIRSEIRQGLPLKAQTDPKIESYVIGDAIEYLDDEILDQLDNVDSGPALEAILGPSGDAGKISEIKKAGDEEIVASYLRKLVMSIQREWQREKAAAK
jgi:hypothetical protein